MSLIEYTSENEFKTNKPKFNNKPNAHMVYHFSDGMGNVIHHDYWVSRACAVVGVIFANTDEGIKVLIEKRSEKMMDEAGKIGIPCGYLDWNETLYDGMMREVFEETSLYIPDYSKYIVYDNNKQPYQVKDSPSQNRQNVSHLFITMFDFKGSNEKFPIEIEKYRNKEVDWVRWLNLVDFYAERHKFEWSFNHDETIETAIKFLNKNFNRNEN